MAMKFSEVWTMLDKIHPLWINADGECEYFENKLDSEIQKYADRTAYYITQDGEGVLTIELADESPRTEREEWLTYKEQTIDAVGYYDPCLFVDALDEWNAREIEQDGKETE